MSKLKKVSYIFVDSENIGNLIPTSLHKNDHVYFFISNPNVLKTIDGLKYDKNFHIIDINQNEEGRELAKNEMDLCIVAKLACILEKKMKKKHKKRIQFIILSHDHGYDAAIEILKGSYKKAKIERLGMSLRKFIEEKPDPYEDLDRKKGSWPEDKAMKNKAKKYRNFALFKESLTPSQRKALRLKYNKNDLNIPIWFEYDFYTDQYILIYSGSCIGRYVSLEDGDKKYQELLHKKKKNPVPSKKYYSRRKNYGTRRRTGSNNKIQPKQKEACSTPKE